MHTRLTTLREQTRCHHDRLEQQLNILRPSFSLDDYRNLLKGFLGYYRPLERCLSTLPDMTTWLPDYLQRVKTPLLEKDLAALGLDSASLSKLPCCTELPKCHDKSTAFGCLYVIEGATLGGQVMSRHFKQTLDLDAERGMAFFSGYGADTLPLWKTFGTYLTHSELDDETLLGAASDTFLTLERWLKESVRASL